jgi:hypothetical protein
MTFVKESKEALVSSREKWRSPKKKICEKRRGGEEKSQRKGGHSL